MSKRAKHGYKSKHIARTSNIPLLGRSPILAHMQSSLAESGHIGRYPLLDIFTQRPWAWIGKYIRTVFNGRYKPFHNYPLDGNSGIYPLHSLSVVQGKMGRVFDFSTRIADASVSSSFSTIALSSAKELPVASGSLAGVIVSEEECSRETLWLCRSDLLRKLISTPDRLLTRKVLA